MDWDAPCSIICEGFFFPFSHSEVNLLPKAVVPWVRTPSPHVHQEIKNPLLFPYRLSLLLVQQSAVIEDTHKERNSTRSECSSALGTRLAKKSLPEEGRWGQLVPMSYQQQTTRKQEALKKNTGKVNCYARSTLQPRLPLPLQGITLILQEVYKGTRDWPLHTFSRKGDTNAHKTINPTQLMQGLHLTPCQYKGVQRKDFYQTLKKLWVAGYAWMSPSEHSPVPSCPLLMEKHLDG